MKRIILFFASHVLFRTLWLAVSLAMIILVAPAAIGLAMIWWADDSGKDSWLWQHTIGFPNGKTILDYLEPSMI